MFGTNKEIVQLLERVIYNQEQIRKELQEMNVVSSVNDKVCERKDPYEDYKDENGLYTRRKIKIDREV